MFLGILGEFLGYPSPSSFPLALPTSPLPSLACLQASADSEPVIGLKWNWGPGCFHWDALGDSACDIDWVVCFFVFCFFACDNFHNYQKTWKRYIFFPFECEFGFWDQGLPNTILRLKPIVPALGKQSHPWWLISINLWSKPLLRYELCRFFSFLNQSHTVLISLSRLQISQN